MSFAQYVAHLEITPGLAYAPFWSAFTQMLRNAMDHQARGQSTQSTIRVSTSVTSDRFSVVVENSGPAAEWDAVRNACNSLGGSVALELRAGEGTRISFVFPKDVALAAGNDHIDPRSQRRAAAPSRRPLRPRTRG